MKIRVWHGKKHDDAEVTEIEVRDLPIDPVYKDSERFNLYQFVTDARTSGGLFTGSREDKNLCFIPWHRVNWIEQVEEQNATEKGQLAQDDQQQHP